VSHHVIESPSSMKSLSLSTACQGVQRCEVPFKSVVTIASGRMERDCRGISEKRNPMSLAAESNSLWNIGSPSSVRSNSWLLGEFRVTFWGICPGLASDRSRILSSAMISLVSVSSNRAVVRVKPAVYELDTRKCELQARCRLSPEKIELPPQRDP